MLFTFFILICIYYKMTITMEEKTYKRQTREVPQDVRDKISASLKGVKKTAEHRKHISDSLRADTGGYWSKIPKSIINSGTTMNL